MTMPSTGWGLCRHSSNGMPKLPLPGLSFMQRPNGPKRTCIPCTKAGDARCGSWLNGRRFCNGLARCGACHAGRPRGARRHREFAALWVYRNNVVAGLIETLKDNYPAVRRIVGSEFFRAMALQFVTANPPHSPVMLGYGAGFAKFIARFEPAATLPYLPDTSPGSSGPGSKPIMRLMPSCLPRGICLPSINAAWPRSG